MGHRNIFQCVENWNYRSTLLKVCENKWQWKPAFSRILCSASKDCFRFKIRWTCTRWRFYRACYMLYFDQSSGKITNFVFILWKIKQNCHIVSDIRTKQNIEVTSKRCFVYLKGSHFAKGCSSKIKCFKCTKRHHVALCDPEESGHSIIALI